jgi:hypothetical protein
MTFGDCPKYFSFAPSGCYLDDEGFRMHWTKQAAIDRCNNALLQLREMSSEGWILDVEEICWGEIRQSAQIFTIRKPLEENLIIPAIMF